MPTSPLLQSPGPARRRFATLLRRGLFTGAVVAVAFTAGRSPAAGHRGVRGDTLMAHETPSEFFTFQSGRTWRSTAERLERRGKNRKVLEHLLRVIERERGSRQAEARLWRGAFIYRHGLYEVAGEVFDSLLAESPHYSMLLRAPIAENAWRAALMNERPAAAAQALEAWRAARERLDEVGLSPDSPETSTAELDSTYAQAQLEIGRICLKWDRDRAAGRAALERALSVGLSGLDDVEARLLLARLVDEEGAHAEAADALAQLLEGPTQGIPSGLLDRLRQARADAEYNAGRFPEARLHYDEILPRITSPADSEWALVQMGDAAYQNGEDSMALGDYEQYLMAFPRGTWAAWVRHGRADADTTGQGS